MSYTYYDYLENYYADYYEYYYWPYYYGNYNGSNTTYNGTYPPSPWKQPYPMDIFNPLFGGITSLCSVLALIITVFVLCQLYYRHRKGTLKSDKITIILTIFCLICHLIACFIDTYGYYVWYIQYDAVLAEDEELYWDIAMIAARLSVYLVFVYRYYKIYRASSVLTKSSKQDGYRTFGIFALVILVQLTLLIVFLPLFFSENIFDDSVNVKRMYLDISWAAAVLDLILIATMGFLLNRSILTLIVHQRAINIQAANGAHQIQPSKSSVTISESGRGFDNSAEENISESFQERQMTLIRATTRIALTCIVSMISTFIYQVVWCIGRELNSWDIEWFTYTWNIDYITNMLCVYLSMAIAKDHYNLLCRDICKCDQCCLKCIMRIISYSTEKKQMQTMLSVGQRSHESVEMNMVSVR